MWHDCVYVAKQRWKSIFFLPAGHWSCQKQNNNPTTGCWKRFVFFFFFFFWFPKTLGDWNSSRLLFSLVRNARIFFLFSSGRRERSGHKERERARARAVTHRTKFFLSQVVASAHHFFRSKKSHVRSGPKNRSGSSPLLQTTNFDSNKLSFAAQNRPVFNGAGDSLFCLVDRRSRLTSFAREGAVSPAASTTRMRWPWRGGGWTDTSFFFWEKKKCMAFFTSTDPLDDAPLLPADSPFVCSEKERKTACRQRPLTG